MDPRQDMYDGDKVVEIKAAQAKLQNELKASLRAVPRMDIPSQLVKYDQGLFTDNKGNVWSHKWLNENGFHMVVNHFFDNQKIQETPQKEPGFIGANTTRTILQKRGTTHGSFKHNAIATTEFSQTFNNIMIAAHKERLTPEVSLAITMIFHKIGRIASGDSYEEDHYKDIMGYAQLALDAIKEMKYNQTEQDYVFDTKVATSQKEV